ncbi:Type I transmembrane sorting receptor, partial [Ceratobasidium sp. 423]
MLASIAIAVTVLAFIGSTVAAPAGGPGPISIPLRKRGSQFSKDGVVIGSALARHASRVEAKYSRNHAAYKTKTAGVLPAGTFNTPWGKPQKEPLTDEQQDTFWAGNITIGTPGRSFPINFDT